MTSRRPVFHFTPRRNWMNDPNGLVYYRGRYHMYFQYNPFGLDWGSMSWGHASSEDLVHWTQHPVAIPCTDDEAIFSGSVVVDWANSSGFGADGETPLVAIYTSVFADGIQAQSLAYSTDGGWTWTKHVGNPVLTRDSTAFRDPKVFRYVDPGRELAYWVMVAVEAEARQLVLYRSDDLRKWSPLTTLGPWDDADQVLECPDLFPLRHGDTTTWVLLVSVNPDVCGDGSATRYFLGDFDGETFTAVAGGPRRLDFGHDCYAAVTFDSEPTGRRIAIGWMSNWSYAADAPTDPWRGSMTVPRELSLETIAGDLFLSQHPARELDHDAEPVALLIPRVLRAADTVVIDTASAFRLDLALETTSALSLRCELVAEDGSSVVIGLDLEASIAFVDRRAALPGQNRPPWGSTAAAHLPNLDGPLSLTVLVDEDSVELFTANGTVTITESVYPRGPWTTLRIEAVTGWCIIHSLDMQTLAEETVSHQ